MVVVRWCCVPVFRPGVERGSHPPLNPKALFPPSAKSSNKRKREAEKSPSVKQLFKQFIDKKKVPQETAGRHTDHLLPIQIPYILYSTFLIFNENCENESQCVFILVYTCKYDILPYISS